MPLVLLKMTNIAFLPFVLLIPSALFSSRVKWFAYIAGCIATGCAVALAWNGYYSWVPSQFGTREEILIKPSTTQPIATALFIVNAVIHQTPDMFDRMFATFGGGPAAYTWTFGGRYCYLAIFTIFMATLSSISKSLFHLIN
jgi:hypothetical protein